MRMPRSKTRRSRGQQGSAEDTQSFEISFVWGDVASCFCDRGDHLGEIDRKTNRIDATFCQMLQLRAKVFVEGCGSECGSECGSGCRMRVVDGWGCCALLEGSLQASGACGRGRDAIDSSRYLWSTGGFGRYLRSSYLRSRAKGSRHDGFRKGSGSRSRSALRVLCC